MKDSNQDAHVKVFKTAINANGDRKDENFINLFSFTLRDIVFDWYNCYIGDHPYCILTNLYLVFYKWFRTIQNDEQVYL